MRLIAPAVSAGTRMFRDREYLERRLLAVYRIFGPLVTAAGVFFLFADRDWLWSLVQKEPFYTLFVCAMFALAFTLVPVFMFCILASAALLLFRDVRLGLPVWILTLAIASFAVPILSHLGGEPPSPWIGGDGLLLMLVVSGITATIEGFRRR